MSWACLSQEWIAYAQTKTARHKLAKFLKDHADLLAQPADAERGSESLTPADSTAASTGANLRSCTDQVLSSTKFWIMSYVTLLVIPSIGLSFVMSHSAVHEQVLNLTIECHDRPGLLAEIAQIISDHGHNIKVSALSLSKPCKSVFSCRMQV
jgi:(p)ppGpp synthase/HD superfamily hydrolase